MTRVMSELPCVSRADTVETASGGMRLVWKFSAYCDAIKC